MKIIILDNHGYFGNGYSEDRSKEKEAQNGISRGNRKSEETSQEFRVLESPSIGN